MRYRTAAILSAVLVFATAGMFGLPAAVWAVFLPSLRQGLPDPIPGYERILLELAVLCSSLKWMLVILALPVMVVFFTVAELTSQAQAGKLRTGTLAAQTGQPPVLWNPNVAAVWSLLLSPAFGAFLHARNADAMGRATEAKANRVWFYVIIAYFGFSLLPIPAIPEVVFKCAPIGLLLGWYFGLGREQVMYVKGTWGNGYRRKPWKTPLIIAVGCLIGTFIALIVVEKLVRGWR